MFRNCGNRSHLLRFLVDHHGRADTAVRVAAAGNLSPIALRPVDDVREIRECTHQREREPVTRRLGNSYLRLHVVCKVGKRITLLQAAFRGDVLVAARE